MSVWEDVKTEIRSNPVLNKKFGDDFVAAIETLLDSVYTNVIPFEEMDKKDWARIKEKILSANEDSVDRRRGDRRKTCPFEGMTAEEWNRIYEAREALQKRSPGRRAADKKE